MFEQGDDFKKKGVNKERKVRNRKQKETTRGKHYYANSHDFRKENYPLPAEFFVQRMGFGKMDDCARAEHA